MINEFTPEVINKIDYYVYRLIDPRSGSTFYVGKGRGNRVFAHMSGALAFEGNENEASAKIAQIRDIHLCGLNVIHIIHRHGLDSETAFEVEAALIDAYPGLSNEANGHNNCARGAMNAQQIQDRYGAESIDEITEKCIIIKVRRWSIDRFPGDTANAIYQATRSAWRLSESRARASKYVLASLDGIIIAVYTDMKWSREQKRDGEKKERLKFDGVEAPILIKEKFISKRIPKQFTKKGNMSPCQYVNC